MEGHVLRVMVHRHKNRSLSTAFLKDIQRLGAEHEPHPLDLPSKGPECVPPGFLVAQVHTQQSLPRGTISKNAIRNVCRPARLQDSMGAALGWGRQEMEGRGQRKEERVEREEARRTLTGWNVNHYNVGR